MSNDYSERSAAFHQERLKSLANNPRLFDALQARDAEEDAMGVGLNLPNDLSPFDRLEAARLEREGRAAELANPVPGARPPAHLNPLADQFPYSDETEEPVPAAESHHVSLLTRSRVRRPVVVEGDAQPSEGISHGEKVHPNQRSTPTVKHPAVVRKANGPAIRRPAVKPEE